MFTGFVRYKLPEFIILFLSQLWCVSIPSGAKLVIVCEIEPIICFLFICQLHSSDVWSTAVKMHKNTFCRLLNSPASRTWYVYCDVFSESSEKGIRRTGNYQCK